MVKYVCCLMWLVSVVPTVDASCLNEAQLATLQQIETQFLLGRIPPAFAHALQDKQVKLAITEATDAADTCSAKLTVEVPADDLAAANRLLEADIAKKIMLSAQGYALPESTQLEAVFKVDPVTLALPAKEGLQVAALGKVRASVEMMYAMLTQAHANIDMNTPNTVAWSAEFLAQQLKACEETFAATANVQSACACRAEGIAKQVSERQMAYISYVKSNPYALATGATGTYDVLEKNVNLGCGLKK
ncbi:MAG TPA: hypothetical protein VGD04_03920 [Methylophilus sp.]